MVSLVLCSHLWQYCRSNEDTACQLKNILFLYVWLIGDTSTVQLKHFFNFPPIPAGQTNLPPAIPLRLHSNITCVPVILKYSPCDPPAIPLCFHPNGWNHRGYKILILSTQVKQGKVHRIPITPLQSHSKLHSKIPVFSLQCFHRNGWNHRG